MHTVTDDTAAVQFLAELSRQHQAETRPAQRPGRSRAERFFAERKPNFYASFQHDSLTRGRGRGGFDGARFDRITEEWNPGSIGPNRLYATGGRFMRDRARDLAVNNPYAKSAVVKFINNVVECGLKPKPQFPDGERRKLWSTHWNKWGGQTAHATREADITADQTIDELTALWLEEVITAGGVLTNYVELPRKGRSIPLAIELIPEERFADHIMQSAPNPKTANPVHAGVEYEQSTGRRIAFHVMPSIPNDVNPYDVKPVRIAAENAEYAFFKRRIGQLRGWTLLHAAIIWLWALGYYADNELINSQIKSMYAAMVVSDSDEDYPDLFDSDPETGATDIYGNSIEKLEPGLIWRGRKGDSITGIGPNVPGGDSLPWIMLIQRSIAVAVEQSYEELTGDYSQGNMSSVRMAAESVRKGYRRMHRFAVNHFGNPTWKRWADHSVRAGIDGFPRPTEYAADLDNWLSTNWSPTKWASPNPVHDATAEKIRKADGTVTDREIVEGRGGDLEEHYDQLAEERRMKEDRQLIGATARHSAEPIDPDTQRNLDEEGDDGKA